MNSVSLNDRGRLGRSSWARRIAAAVVAVAGLTLVPAAGAVTAPLYPDLRMPSPSDVELVQWPVDSGARHYQLRFATMPSNYGRGALEVQRVPTESGIADFVQRVYHEPAGFHDENLAQVAFAPTDTTFVIPGIARYELWSRKDFDRAQARDFRRGQPLDVRHNVSHCIRDVSRSSEGSLPLEPFGPVYQFCSKFVQGISPGWRTLESWTEDQQYFDFGLTPPPDGEYVIRAIVDPDNLLFESEGKTDPARESEVANSGVTYIRVVGGVLAGIEDL